MSERPSSTILPAALAQQAAAPGQLRQAYEAQQTLLAAQPALVRRFLAAQAGLLAEAVASRERLPQLRFALPDAVVVDAASGEAQPIPPEFREQLAGGLLDRLTRADA